MVAQSYGPSMSEIANPRGDWPQCRSNSVYLSQLDQPTVTPLPPAVIHNSNLTSQTPLSPLSADAPGLSPSAASTTSTAVLHATETPESKDGPNFSFSQVPHSESECSHKSPYSSHKQRLEERSGDRTSVRRSRPSNTHGTTVRWAEDNAPDTDLVHENMLRLTVISLTVIFTVFSSLTRSRFIYRECAVSSPLAHFPGPSYLSYSLP